jgi:hypothetical protein
LPNEWAAYRAEHPTIVNPNQEGGGMPAPDLHRADFGLELLEPVITPDVIVIIIIVECGC